MYSSAREEFAGDLGALGYLDGEAGAGEEDELRAPKPWLWSPPPRLELPR
jgi:hypothetical protein